MIRVNHPLGITAVIAAFAGTLDEYVIEGRGTRIGNIVQSARDLNGDGRPDARTDD